MPSPQLTPELIAEVSSLVSGYIIAQREEALPLAMPLSPAQRASLEGFFLPQVLDARLLVLTESRVVNPHFYVPLRRMGFTNLPNFSTMAALRSRVCFFAGENGTLASQPCWKQSLRTMDLVVKAVAATSPTIPPRANTQLTRWFRHFGCHSTSGLGQGSF